MLDSLRALLDALDQRLYGRILAIAASVEAERLNSEAFFQGLKRFSTGI